MESDDEARRIDFKTDAALAVDQLKWAGANEGMRVLDLGCAGGTSTKLICTLVDYSGRVLGLDVSHRRLAHARSSSPADALFCAGDARALPLSSNVFDLTWCRFLFEYLESPQSVLDEMVRVTRPSGTVCVSDIDGNCLWHDGMTLDLRTELDEALDACSSVGFAPRAGLSLYSMACRAGLTEIAVDVRPYHVIAGTIGMREERAWDMKFSTLVPVLVRLGWTHRRAVALKDGLISFFRDPSTFTYSTLITVRGRKALCVVGLLAALASPAFASKDEKGPLTFVQRTWQQRMGSVHVRSDTKKDGTDVESHMPSAPHSSTKSGSGGAPPRMDRGGLARSIEPYYAECAPALFRFRRRFGSKGVLRPFLGLVTGRLRRMHWCFGTSNTSPLCIDNLPPGYLDRG
jgi:SAM-dependent methyltransferase